ncbi:MAG: hypothetical protein AABZ09_01155, partial [Candidatus Binatota bacterium]
RAQRGQGTGPSAAAESALPEDSAHRLWFGKLTTLSQSKSAQKSRPRGAVCSRNMRKVSPRTDFS